MRLPQIVYSKANKGDKVAQAFVQQYGDVEGQYQNGMWEQFKAQFEQNQGGENDLQQFGMQPDYEKDLTPTEERANEAIEEYGDKYKEETNNFLSEKTGYQMATDDYALARPNETAMFDYMDTYASDEDYENDVADIKGKDDAGEQMNYTFPKLNDSDLKKAEEIGLVNKGSFAESTTFNDKGDVILVGSQQQLDEFADYLGYQLNEDYLMKDSDFDYEDLPISDNSNLSDYDIEDDYENDVADRDNPQQQEQYLAPEEIITDYNYPEEDIQYYEKKNNVKLQQMPDGSFKVIPRQEKIDNRTADIHGKQFTLGDFTERLHNLMKVSGDEDIALTVLSANASKFNMSENELLDYYNKKYNYENKKLGGK